MLAASGLLPLAFAAVLGAGYLIRDAHQAAQRSALELSRALATAVHAELDSTVAVLETLAHSGYLAEGRMSEFHRQADRVARQRGWRRFQLADASGRIVLSTDSAWGQAIPPPLDPSSLQVPVFLGAPVIGNAREDRDRPGRAFPVRAPFMRDGQVVGVLTAVVDTDQVLNVLTRQNVPPGWLVGIFDKEGQRVARTTFHATTRPSPSLQAMLDTGAAEGMGPTYTLEGAAAFSGFSRLVGSGWVVAVGVAKQSVDLALMPVLLSLGAGLLASVGLALYMAWFFARRVSEPMGLLKQAAVALGRGDRVTLPSLGISELDEVGTALNQAFRDRDEARAELDTAAAQRELLLQQVGESLRAAEEAIRGKDEFLAVLGHELRNPLAPITMALHLMDRKCDEGTRPEREMLQRQLRHMVRLVDDLLDVSRVTSNGLSLVVAPMQPAALVEAAAEALRPLLDGRSLQVRIEPAAANAWASGDDVRFTQVLNNVLGNALKFTAATGRIEVAVFRHDADLWIEVRDDGAGMSSEVLARAFDAFYQAPQPMHRPRGGLGLGLAIVKNLMELHGGGARASSAGPGLGTTLTLSLPCIQRPALEPAPARRTTPSGDGRVLVVDDNRDGAEVTATLLSMAGYAVQVAHDPLVALELAPAFCPDAMLLDIGLPGMSGYALATAFRGAPHCFTGVLVAVTGFGAADDVAQALAAGFDAHLTKPVEAGVLLNLLAVRLKAPDSSLVADC